MATQKVVSNRMIIITFEIDHAHRKGNDRMLHLTQVLNIKPFDHVTQ